MAEPHTGTGFKIDLSDLLKSGLYLGRFPKTVPFWADTDGIQFTPHGIKRKPGRSLLFDAGSEPIRGLQAVNEFDTKVLYAGDLSNLYSYRLDTDSTDTVGAGYNLVEKAGASIWDSGSSTWDSGSSVWDEGIVEASQWSMTNFGSWVFAANGVDKIQVKKGNINFNDLSSDEISGATVNAGGSGYADGDTITFTGGSGSGFAATVTEVLGGAVTAFEITNFGSGYANGETLSQNTTSGSGAGFTCDITVPDATFTKARIVQKAGRHILVANYEDGGVDYPTSFAWCDEDDPDTWVPASTNAAGSLNIREANSEIRCVKPLGDGWGFYTSSQLFLVSYTAAPFYFGYRRVAASGLGAISPHSVVPVGRLNYGLYRKGLFSTDGVSVNNLGVAEGIDQWLTDNASFSEAPQIVGYHNERDKEVVWVVPVGDTTPTKELFYNYSTGTFGMRSSSLTAMIPDGVFLNAITGDKDGQVFFEDEGSSAQTTTATSAAHDLDDADHIKEVTSIRVGKQGSGNPVIRVGWANTINGAPTYTDTFTVNETFHEEYLRTSGRYLFLNISSSSPSDSWEISNMEIIGRIGGTR